MERGGLKPGFPVPLKDVVFDARTGGFLAEGNDPQMLWTCPRDRADLQGRGAVSVTLGLVASEGRANPVVYADWGDGFSDETQRALSWASEGVYRAVLHSNAGSLRRLRIDPSDAPCAFTLTHFQVEPAADAAHPTRRLSRPRRLARALLRRLPLPVQVTLRRGAARVRAGLAGQTRGLGGWFTPKQAWRQAYAQSFAVAQNLRSPEFAAPPLAPPRKGPGAPRVLAFYLPQFHPIPENDAWWGAGFTEWSNVSKATPQFTGHLQPRLPSHFGYYDLRAPQVRRLQADLARNIGLDGFCFHYYWFAGKRLLEQPLDAFVDDLEIDFPFALCWANENWTRRWDGQENEILIGQNHSPEDDIAVIDDLARYMASPRYIRVEGRPFILVYRPDALPDAKATLGRWRERARTTGLGELFVACTNAFGFTGYEAAGFDALVEFPPHALSIGEITHTIERLNPGFSGRVYDFQTVVDAQAEALLALRDDRRMPGVMPGWDNEARKPGAGHVFHNATPWLFHRWVAAALAAAANVKAPDRRLVFVNAWNEWAEGAYLEPDRWFGNAFGQALRSAIEDRAPRLSPDIGRRAPVTATTGRAKAVVLLHLYYADMTAEFAARLKPLEGLVDVAISFPEIWTDAEFATLSTAFPRARLAPYANRGRDVAPFIGELKWAAAQGYDLFCKLHSKRSPHMAGGDAWRGALVSPLLDHAAVAIVRLQGDPALGLLADADARMTLGEPGVMHNNGAAMAVLSKRLGFAVSDETAFPAGSMFWGRTAAFKPLIDAEALPFEPELGRIDGTAAHALERAMAAIAASAGYRADWDLSEGPGPVGPGPVGPGPAGPDSV